MIRAYYTGTNGAISNQNYLDVLSNNMANIQTDGYKKSKAEFSDLLYKNIQGADGKIQVGSGSKINKVDTIYEQGDPYSTGNDTDYAIIGDGFFGVQFNDEMYFTRGGSFQISNIDDERYLTYHGGYVLDENEEPILLEEGEDIKDAEYTVGVFNTENNSKLTKVGDNLFKLDEGAEYTLLENPKLMKGSLESSGVELADEMMKLIQVQRAFQFNSKVIQTADEIEQTINSLKN